LRAEALDTGLDTRPMKRDVSATASRQTSHLLEAETEAAYLLERLAAIEQLLTKPAPRAFPLPSRIDAERIERTYERAQSAVGGVRLRVKLLRQLEVASHGAVEQRLRK